MLDHKLIIAIAEPYTDKQIVTTAPSGRSDGKAISNGEWWTNGVVLFFGEDTPDGVGKTEHVYSNQLAAIQRYHDMDGRAVLPTWLRDDGNDWVVQMQFTPEKRSMADPERFNYHTPAPPWLDARYLSAILSRIENGAKVSYIFNDSVVKVLADDKPVGAICNRNQGTFDHEPTFEVKYKGD